MSLHEVHLKVKGLGRPTRILACVAGRYMTEIVLA
jgi:hypothetical protein